MPAPIAVFAYKRPRCLQRMLATLTRCEGFAQSRVVAFVDAPANEAEEPKVAEVLKLLRSLGLSNLEVVPRAKHLGLRESIFQGVGEVCDSAGRVIVLEDDLLLSSRALSYFNHGLDKYQDDPRVWSVVGYQYQVPALGGGNQALVLPFTHPWGWATWRRAWQRYDMHAPISQRAVGSKAFRNTFDAHGVRDFSRMLLLVMAGKINSWFTPWYFRMCLEHGVSIFPPRTYVLNTGIRRGGTHASGLNPYYMLVPPAEPWEGVCTLPDDLCVDYWALDAIANSWDARVQRVISHLGRIKRCLKS